MLWRFSDFFNLFFIFQHASLGFANYVCPVKRNKGRQFSWSICGKINRVTALCFYLKLHSGVFKVNFILYFNVILLISLGFCVGIIKKSWVDGFPNSLMCKSRGAYSYLNAFLFSMILYLLNNGYIKFVFYIIKGVFIFCYEITCKSFLFNKRI